jgi:hypothetical protein
MVLLLLYPSLQTGATWIAAKICDVDALQCMQPLCDRRRVWRHFVELLSRVTGCNTVQL